MSGFSVDPDRLAGAAPQFTDLANQLDQSLATLQSTLDSVGSYWGDDEAGRQYAAKYLPARDALMRYQSDAAAGLRDLADRVAEWSGSYSDTEQDVIDAM